MSRSARSRSPSCEAHPDFTFSSVGVDIAFCTLETPVEDVPIVPMLMGCETDALQEGTEVQLVGFGDADDGAGYGPKRAVDTVFNGIIDGEAWIGGNGESSCYGDSGGPAYIRLEDQSWRVFGVTSWGPECGVGDVQHA